MKTIKLFLASVFLAGAVAGTAACSSNPVDEAVKLADELCACKDIECAKKVEEKLDKLEGIPTSCPRKTRRSSSPPV